MPFEVKLYHDRFVTIITLEMSWRVLCFYVLSAYPGSYNSDHTNNTYVFVVLETGQGFLNEDNQCVL